MSNRFSRASATRDAIRRERTEPDCPGCGHLTAVHSTWPIPANPTPYAWDARPVCHACRTSIPPQQCPTIEEVTS